MSDMRYARPVVKLLTDDVREIAKGNNGRASLQTSHALQRCKLLDSKYPVMTDGIRALRSEAQGSRHGALAFMGVFSQSGI